MKRILSLAMASLLVCGAATSVAAANKVEGRKTCEAYIADVTVDGKVDDVWKYAPAYEVTNVKTYEKDTYYKEGMKTGVDYAKETCKVLWDGKGTLYVLAEVQDKNLFFENDKTNTWYNDGVEVFWCLTNSTDKSAEKVQTRFPLGTATLNGDKVLKYASAKTADGWTLEVAIDVSKVGGAGQYLGIDFQYNDSVLGKTRQVCLGWSDTTDKASQDPSVYGQCLLSATKVADVKAAAEKAAKTAAKTADPVVLTAVSAVVSACAAVFAKKKH